MAILSRLSRVFLGSQRTNLTKVNNFSTAPKASNKKWLIGGGLLLGVAGGIGATMCTMSPMIDIDAHKLQCSPPAMPWPHKELLGSYDHSSMRRGWQVYKEVCSACHSMHYINYYHLINATHSREEAKALAADAQIWDGPNNEGKDYQRPGRLTDRIYGPYRNDVEARLANNGALPPDLTFIVLGRKGGEDYVFHLLLYYCDPPAGVKLGEGQAYNPFFDGAGGLGMPRILFDGMVSYEDGTKASAAQMAWDVVNFLAWAGDPYLDERKKVATYVFPTLFIMLAATFYAYRFHTTYYKTMHTQWVPRIRKTKS